MNAKNDVPFVAEMSPAGIQSVTIKDIGDMLGSEYLSFLLGFAGFICAGSLWWLAKRALTRLFHPGFLDWWASTGSRRADKRASEIIYTYRTDVSLASDSAYLISQLMQYMVVLCFVSVVFSACLLIAVSSTTIYLRFGGYLIAAISAATLIGTGTALMQIAVRVEDLRCFPDLHRQRAADRVNRILSRSGRSSAEIENTLTKLVSGKL